MTNGKVVEEKSACIDGHRKEALPTDHLKINKYCGPEDPSYKTVYPIIKEMIENAVKKVQGRLKRTCCGLHVASYAYPSSNSSSNR